MTPRLMARLDLLAETGEARLLDEIKRQTATLAQVAEQQAVLENYRNRLTQSWRSGKVIDAGSAKRAGHFCSASQTAETQIEQLAAQTRKQLEVSLQNLAAAKAHRQSLATAQAKAALQSERTAENRAEQPRANPILLRAARSS
jgi:flagellar biosynthesis chaperone FliJ